MPLKTLVKVGKITNLSDARYCAGMNVDMLGFVTVETQENYLPVKDYQDIRGWVSGPKVVAEVYGVRSTEELNAILENYRPDYLELSSAELGFINTPLPVLLRLENSEDVTIPSHLTLYAIIVKNAQVKTNTFNKNALVFLDAADSSTHALLSTEAIDGIVLSGSKEESPGLKDYDHLAEVLESLEVE